MSEEIDVQHNTGAKRFEAKVAGDTAYAEYRIADDGVMVFTHTIVPEAAEGRGVAGKLVKTALEHARAKDLRVYAECPYVESYLKRHPEYRDMVDE
jgi:predicted GNAT family acetyltransferase